MYSVAYRIDYPCFAEEKELSEDVSDLERIKIIAEKKRPKAVHQELCQRPEPMYQSDYFQQPWLYFWADGDYLKCLWWRVKLRMISGEWDQEDREIIKQYYPELRTNEDQNYVLETIYFYLRALKFTRYYKYLQEFKWESGLQAIPLFERKGWLSLDRGRLVCFLNGQKSLLTDRLVTELIRSVGGIPGEDNGLKRKLAKEIIKYIEEDDRCSKQTASLRFGWGEVSYQELTGQIRVRRYPHSSGMLRRKPERWVLSQSGKECLRELAGEDRGAFDSIAELIAKLHMPWRPSDYLWVISGRQDSLQSFMKFILNFAFLDERYCDAVYERDAQKRGRRLAESQAALCPLQVNVKALDGQAFRRINHEMLKRFVKGEKVGDIEDPFIVTEAGETVYGSGVLMYKTAEVDFAELKRIPHKIIYIPDGWKPQFSAEDYMWLQCTLAYYGQEMMEGVELNAQEEKPDVASAIKTFAKAYFKMDESSYIDVKLSHDRFEKYAKMCLGLDKKELWIEGSDGKRKRNLGSTLFSEEVTRLTGIEATEERQNKNRKAFKGYTFDEGSLADDIKKAEKKRQEESKSSVGVDQILDSIADSIVLEHW